MTDKENIMEEAIKNLHITLDMKTPETVENPTEPGEGTITLKAGLSLAFTGNLYAVASMLQGIDEKEIRAALLDAATGLFVPRVEKGSADADNQVGRVQGSGEAV